MERKQAERNTSMNISPLRCVHVAVLSLLFTSLLFGAARAQGPSAAQKAVAASDIAALRAALHEDAGAMDGATLSALLRQAIRRLAESDSSDKEEAREIIHVLAASGAPLDRAFETVLGDRIGMPATWIARIPGERRLAVELIGTVPEDLRCPMIVDMAGDGNKGQWENAVAALDTLPSQKRASPECLDLFRIGIRAADPSTVALRMKSLLASGMVPRAQEAARILAVLPADRAGADVAENILKSVDPDAPLPLETFDGYPYRPASLFAYLVNVSLGRFSTPLQQNLASLPAWAEVLARHDRREETCVDQNIQEAAGAWQNADPEDRSLILLRAATGWLIRHCAVDSVQKLPWTDMVRRGGRDLVVAAMDRGAVFSDPASIINTAICERDAELAIGLMRRDGLNVGLSAFLACLTPAQLTRDGAGDLRMLSWLIRHGADPDEAIADASPLAVAELYDRREVAEALKEAGAGSTPFTGEGRRLWLGRLLRLVAGFPPDPLPFEDGYQDTPWSMNVDEKDLDGDGRPEYIVWDNCGSAVCDFAVLMKAGHQWRVLLNDAGSLEQLATKHLGWSDLRVSGRVAAAEYQMTVYRFDGVSYLPLQCETATYEGDGDPVVRPVPCAR